MNNLPILFFADIQHTSTNLWDLLGESTEHWMQMLYVRCLSLFFLTKKRLKKELIIIFGYVIKI